MSHTPKPWEVFVPRDGSNPRIVHILLDDEHNFIHSKQILPFCTYDLEEVQCDRHLDDKALIEASPYLLEALEGAMRTLHMLHGEDCGCKECRKGNAALFKATRGKW